MKHLLDQYGRPYASDDRMRTRMVRAKFDAAQTVNENTRHWANTDALAADAAASYTVRKTLRERARYEVANNSYARGIVLSLANDTIGTGPRLQVLFDGEPRVNEQLEQEFARWSWATRLPRKLRTMRMARCVDGEAFGLFVNNDRLGTPVQLDVRLIEADQCRTPDMLGNEKNQVDGIRYDKLGNPLEYHILRAHPGTDTWSIVEATEYDKWPSESVIHLFRLDRPDLHRGIPEITPALPLFAQLRRYTLAVIAAAETAAEIAAVLYTDSPAIDPDEVEPLDYLDLNYRQAMTLPMGWKLGQTKPEQPATTYSEFKSEILDEILRCLLMPHNVGVGNSSDYNYASGRLDHQTYHKAIAVDRSDLEAECLDRIFAQWLYEARRIPEYLPPLPEEVPHEWYWDGFAHVDPVKEATAKQILLDANLTTLAYEYAQEGRDWEKSIRQRGRELQALKAAGLEQEPEPKQETADAKAE